MWGDGCPSLLMKGRALVLVSDDLARACVTGVVSGAGALVPWWLGIRPAFAGRGC